MEMKFCPLLFLFLMFTFSQKKEAYGSCCESKVVGDNTYILLSEDNTKTSEYGCIDGCIYRHIDDESVTPEKVCFKPGILESMCTEEPYVLPGGCIGPHDKFPKYWIPLLKDPCGNIRLLYDAPACLCGGCYPQHNKVQNIGIVGAGMAGLTMAWILQYIGHKVTLIEATDRVGGRAFTHYGSGWYGDLGAMRFPPRDDQPLTYQLFDQFNIPLQTFTNTNQGTSYFYVAGKYFSSEDFKNNDQGVLKEIYQAFGILTNGTNGSFPKFQNGTLQNPSSSNFDHLFPNNFTAACRLDESLENVYRKALKKANLPLKLINLWSVLELQRAMLPFSAYQYLYDIPLQHQKRAEAKGEQFNEVVNGVSVLPEAILKNITNVEKQSFGNRYNVSIRYNSPVQQVTITENDNVTLMYKANNKPVYETFDKVILTPTSRVVSLMQFSPPLHYDKTYALNSFHFMNSVKVFLAFHTPFWATENKVHKIPFDSKKTNGGSGITDLPIRSLYYPSHPNHGNSILVSYVWGEDADRLTALPDEELIQKSLAYLVDIHGEVARETFKEGKVQKWMEEDWTVGAFAWARPGHIQNLEDALRAPHGLPGKERVFFAGEYTSKFDHGWIQAAVESACRVSHDMFRLDGGEHENVYPG